MSGGAGRLRMVRWLGFLLVALSLFVVGASAYLRLDAAGLGCADWPACYGQLLAGEPPPLYFGPARVFHRAVASLSLIVAVIVVWQCWRRPPLMPVAWPATALLGLMLVLSALGIWSTDPRLTVVNLLNILGGLGLVSFSWRVVLATSPSAGGSAMDAAHPLLRLGALCLTLTVFFGAMIGARHAALTCASFPDCAGNWFPRVGAETALGLLASLSGAPQAGDRAGEALHLLHRYSALATLLLLGGGAWRALDERSKRRSAMLMLALLPAEVLLGGLLVLGNYSIEIAVAHGACAAAMLATLVSLLRR
ncbi:COX15/CtaA family protein [Accumulibacter sp.]|uniref:COX15/CtaA family protein n=1 Tax=Accumulibacter sp. TaxID=2053492 RepID=UPI0025EED191|nr:COX15/CtaA family protein [Accumulibacter sp.]MCM8596794.1 COX15/CtaA family protein [Accumulibacter sp.]MCM8624672.1 COX15/CtaA family protein [Accumulibacter sp.]MDS4050942.1 COX15/CtaA family protein [Accumulibacter sp.]